jgi:hypothetical protein
VLLLRAEELWGIVTARGRRRGSLDSVAKGAREAERDLPY